LELAGATKSGIEQQISNKRALNFYVSFICAEVVVLA